MTKTINTYYCDRCGEEMPANYEPYCSTSPKTRIQILRNRWEYVDLCDKCKKSFEAWWNKKEV